MNLNLTALNLSAGNRRWAVMGRHASISTARGFVTVKPYGGSEQD